MDYELLIANYIHISKLVDIGIESGTEICDIEIRKRIDNDFYYICIFKDKIIAKCLIKKCRLTEDDDNTTYYIREVYKNKYHLDFKMIHLLNFAISHISNISNISNNIKLFVEAFNERAIYLYKKLNFEIIKYNEKYLKYTDEYYNDKTYYKNHSHNDRIMIYEDKLIRPDRNTPFYKMFLKTAN